MSNLPCWQTGAVRHHTRGKRLKLYDSVILNLKVFHFARNDQELFINFNYAI